MMQGGQAFGDQILMRRKMIIGQRFPVRQQMHAQFWGEKRDFFDQSLRL